MELKNKLLVGLTLCGAIALNNGANNRAEEVLKDENASVEMKGWAQKTQGDAEVFGGLLGLTTIGLGVAEIGRYLNKRAKKSAYDLDAAKETQSKDMNQALMANRMSRGY